MGVNLIMDIRRTLSIDLGRVGSMFNVYGAQGDCDVREALANAQASADVAENELTENVVKWLSYAPKNTGELDEMLEYAKELIETTVEVLLTAGRQQAISTIVEDLEDQKISVNFDRR